MMKSAGEQSAGQAPFQGFSAQYSQRSISARSCASLRTLGTGPSMLPLAQYAPVGPAVESVVAAHDRVQSAGSDRCRPTN
jgi:hypothetical protein